LDPIDQGLTDFDGPTLLDVVATRVETETRPVWAAGEQLVDNLWLDEVIVGAPGS